MDKITNKIVLRHFLNLIRCKEIAIFKNTACSTKQDLQNQSSLEDAGADAMALSKTVKHDLLYSSYFYTMHFV